MGRGGRGQEERKPFPPRPGSSGRLADQADAGLRLDDLGAEERLHRELVLARGVVHKGVGADREAGGLVGGEPAFRAVAHVVRGDGAAGDDERLGRDQRADELLGADVFL